MKLLWQQIGNMTITEILCKSDFDGVVFDTEHGCFNNETLYSCIQIASLLNKKCLVRVTDLNKQLIRMCLDAGCNGIIMSTIETYEQAKQFYKYCLYPNIGYRGQGLVRENFWGELEFKKREPILIAQIETKLGVMNINQINRISFDYFLVGPYDLSASYGDVGNFNSEPFQHAMNILRNEVGYKLGYHIVKDIDKQYNNLKDCKFLAFGLDTLFLTNEINNIYKKINEVKDK